MLECWSVEVYSVGVLRCTVWEFCGVQCGSVEVYSVGVLRCTVWEC